LLLSSLVVQADTHVSVGDVELRHDLEYLADRGLISIPITTWPMSWAEISQAVESIDEQRDRSVHTRAIVTRLINRLQRATHTSNPTFNSRYSLSSGAQKLRGFRDIPRGDAEISGSVGFIGQSFASKLQITLAGSPQDSQNLRFDGSYIGYLWKNVAINAGYQERWWGPGQLGSLILSSNARPVPGVSIKRHVALRSNYRALSWMGPWTAHAFAGKMENDRFVNRPYLLGARVAIKPFPSLELGASRTAQWGGDGRPTSFDSLVNLLIGRDNQGEGVSREEEPGNQLAGFDGRFSFNRLGLPVTLYGQLIGEDEAGGFPSRYMGQFGLSTSMPVNWQDSTLRLNAEYSDTTCQFYESSRIFNCAYGSSIYRTGYRYRNRAIGYSTDNDARQIALLATLNTASNHNWSAALRVGELNRGGAIPETVNTVSEIPRDFVEIEVNHSRLFNLGKLEMGIGYSQREDNASAQQDGEFNAFVSWTSFVP